MKLADLAGRTPPTLRGDGSKIPWHEPGFSARMLREHLSQSHDQASRRGERIDAQVGWLHREVLGGRAARVLDLGCGPGLYTSRLARLAHTCLGVDFSPASIEHARAEAARDGLACVYRLADLREGGFGSGFELALMIFGELNTFPPDEAQALLCDVRHALEPGGRLVVEVHNEAAVRALGAQPQAWQGVSSGLFSDEPHLWLRESAWSEHDRAAIQRYFVIEQGSDQVTEYRNTGYAYSDEDYLEMLRQAGFARVEAYASLDGSDTTGEDGLEVRVAAVASVDGAVASVDGAVASVDGGGG